MKKILLSIGFVTLVSSFAIAQDNHAGHNHDHSTVSAAPPVKAAPSNAAPTQGTANATINTNMKPEDMIFTEEIHDFGTIPEGPKAEYEFSFVNNGSEPIVIQQVHASCGCTTPSYSKEPVKPGKKGAIKAVYNTQGRPAPFNKTITVVSNAGTKVLVIKGTVEKTPDSSVPKSNSMMKTF